MNYTIDLVRGELVPSEDERAALVLAGYEREAVERLQDAMEGMPQVDIDTGHALAGETYARTIFIPAGTVLTGATQTRDHVCVVFGDISVTTDDGVRRLTGYHVLTVKAGMKRAGFAHADTWWTTVAHTKETDLEMIEQDLVQDPETLQDRKRRIGVQRFERLEG